MIDRAIVGQPHIQRNTSNLSTQTKLRWAFGAMVILDLAATWAISNPGLNILIFCGSTLALAVPAAVMAVRNARSFGTGNPSRRAWLMIAPLGLVDCALFLSYLFGAVALGAQGDSAPVSAVERAGSIILGASAVSLVSRIMLAYVLWMAISIYRQSGLELKLQTRDYFSLIVLLGLLALSVMWSAGAMRLQLGALVTRAPGLLREFDYVEYPRLLVLAVCSVLGVVVWRYANQMGGGLVSKAWRSILLFAAVYLLRFVFTGSIAQLMANGAIGAASTTAWRLVALGSWMLIVSEYMLFLGVSYQYEACTSDVNIRADELEAFAERGA